MLFKNSITVHWIQNYEKWIIITIIGVFKEKLNAFLKFWAMNHSKLFMHHDDILFVYVIKNRIFDSCFLNITFYKSQTMIKRVKPKKLI